MAHGCEQARRARKHIRRKREILEKKGSTCGYCGRETIVRSEENKRKYNDKRDNWRTVDHIVPLLKGGTNELRNLTISCYRCNLEKGELLLAEWIDRWYLKQ
jgi:5-methylcytosine-specific restriction endonuclease McrA